MTLLLKGVVCHTRSGLHNVNDLSQLLLDYIAAKRDGIRDLEFVAFAEILPYNFVCGQINYARWGTLKGNCW